MPSLQFGNLGSSPSTPRTSVAGSLYFLAAEKVPITLVFDTRRYLDSDREMVTYKMIGTVRIPVLSRMWRCLMPRTPADEELRLRSRLETVRDVCVVNLSGQAPTPMVPRLGRISWLFPNRHIWEIQSGTTAWSSMLEAAECRPILESIEETGLVEREEKNVVGPFTLFFFKSKSEGSPRSVLVTGGMDEGRPFALFLAEEGLQEFFPRDQVDTKPNQIRWLSANTWYSFYSLTESMPYEVST